jgi:adenylate kinase
VSRIVFLGPPGAGKGTQAARLAKLLGVPHVSTGDMLRAAASAGSDLGRRVKSILDGGELVPDLVMEGVVAQRLRADDCRAGFVLDGYPRTIPQAYFLAGVLAGLGASTDHVCLIEVPPAELTARMLKRARGPDDAPDVIRRRIEDYEQKTAPLVEFYAARDLVRRVDGVGGLDEVFARLERAVTAARR